MDAMRKCTVILVIFLFPGLTAQRSSVKADAWDGQLRQLVSLLEYSLNILGDPESSNFEKETIIRESYLRYFASSETLIEDDLVPNRRVPTLKAVSAYLRDIDFFFKKAEFSFNIEQIQLEWNEQKQPYFRVQMERTLSATEHKGETWTHKGPRTLEIALDTLKQELRILSMYNRAADFKGLLSTWWEELDEGWKLWFAERIKLPDQQRTLADVIRENPGFQVGKTYAYREKSFKVTAGAVAKALGTVLESESIDLSDANWISDSEPLSRFTRLKTLILNRSSISEIKGLRSLSNLRELQLNECIVEDLSPLEYTRQLKKLSLNGARFSTTKLPAIFPELEYLDLRRAGLNSLSFLSVFPELKELIADGNPIKGLSGLPGNQLFWLSLNQTPLMSIEGIGACNGLQRLDVEKTALNQFTGLDSLPNLRIIYADGTPLSPEGLGKWNSKLPGLLIVFESDALRKWWSALPSGWHAALLPGQRKNQEIPVREVLHKLLAIDSLDLSSSGINDLKPLAQFSRLRYLKYHCASAVSMESLSFLRHLEVLDLAGCGTLALNQLTNASRLSFLRADSMDIQYIPSLHQLPSLTHIQAEGYWHGRDSLLEFCSVSKTVLWESSQLNSWWASLSATWKELFCVALELPNRALSPAELHRLLSLKKFSARGRNLQNLDPLMGIRQLREIDLSGSGLSNLNQLSNFPNLTYLYLQKLRLRDLSFLVSLSKLEMLDLSFSSWELVRDLPALPRLQSLSVAGTAVSSLSGIQKFPALQTLDISYTRIHNPGPVSSLSLNSLRAMNTPLRSWRVRSLKQQNPGLQVHMW
jgi:Leucine-rich repeat (LRR) protein